MAKHKHSKMAALMSTATLLLFTSCGLTELVEALGSIDEILADSNYNYEASIA